MNENESSLNNLLYDEYYSSIHGYSSISNI
jgi:hypothetical protein